MAKELGARTVWHGAELSEEEAAGARRIVEAKGLAYIHGVDIAAATRALDG
jgi:hypothetical protein